MKRPKKFDSSRPFFQRRKDADERDYGRPDARRQPDDRRHGDDRRRPDDDRQLPAVQRSEVFVDSPRNESSADVALAKPLGDLAKAFAMQAEMLKAVHETQSKLAQAIENDKRSEAVVQSTSALNETFRGVRSVQQSLVEKLEKSERAGSRWRVLAVIGILAAAGAVGFILMRVDDRDRETRRDLDSKLARVEATVEGVHERALSDARSDRDALREAYAKSSGTAEELKKLLERALDEKSRLEKETDTLRAGLETARTTSADLDKKSQELGRRNEQLEGEARQHLSKLDEARLEIDHLKEQVIARLQAGERLSEKALDSGREKPVADLQNGETNGATGAGSDAPTAAPKTANAETTKVEETAPADPAAKAKEAQTILNRLLEKHRSNHVYRVDSIGAVGKDVLEDVVLTEAAPGRGVIKSVAAKRLQFVVSPQGDIVELNFEEGGVRQAGQGGRLGNAAPFYNNKYRLTVMCLNGDDWMKCREPFVVTR